MRNYTLGVGAIVLCAFVASIAHANEINYGHIEKVVGDSIYIEYKGPGGATYFTCNTSGKCAKRDDAYTSRLPAIAGSRIYEHNEDATLAVRPLVFGSYVVYVLYDISGEKAKLLGRIPVTVSPKKFKFTASGDQILFLDGSIAELYDINKRKMYKTTLSQSDLPQMTISSDGTYLAAYNYNDPGYRIWNLTKNSERRVSSESPGYFEFSHDEDRGAYVGIESGYRSLFVVDLDDSNLRPQQITNKATVEDYLFAGDTLFYLANTERPYDWTLTALSPKNEKTIIEQNASYGDYIKAIDDKLAYLVVDGKNTNVHLYDTDSETVTVLDPIGDSPAESSITREVKKIDGRYGVLLSPERRPNDTLFIWLHGGPQRQTSVNYHPYLSYAVYDELLEKLAASGSYVYKLDYLGSWGYGNKFMEALHKQIGIADLADIENVIDELKKELDVDKIYVIGNSYGGYLSLKAIADLSDKLDGAVSINGVSNWHSLVSRIPSTPFAKLFEGTPDLHNLDAYKRAEVFTGLVNEVKNEPILVVYGQNDATVPTWQSTEYIQFANAHNKNIETLVLPEDHIIRSRESLAKLCSVIEDTFNLRRLSCDG